MLDWRTKRSDNSNAISVFDKKSSREMIPKLFQEASHPGQSEKPTGGRAVMLYPVVNISVHHPLRSDKGHSRTLIREHFWIKQI